MEKSSSSDAIGIHKHTWRMAMVGRQDYPQALRRSSDSLVTLANTYFTSLPSLLLLSNIPVL